MIDSPDTLAHVVKVFVCSVFAWIVAGCMSACSGPMGFALGEEAIKAKVDMLRIESGLDPERREARR